MFLEKDFFGNGFCRLRFEAMPYAQNALRVLRYAFTLIRNLAQRGPDKAAERPPKGVGSITRQGWGTAGRCRP